MKIRIKQFVQVWQAGTELLVGRDIAGGQADFLVARGMAEVVGEISQKATTPIVENKAVSRRSIRTKAVAAK